MIRDRSFTAAAGARLDAALLAAFPSTTRAFARDAIARGDVLVDGRRAPKGTKLRGGETVAVAELLEASDNLVAPGTGPCPPAVFEDDSILAFDKPAGMCVQPLDCRETGTLMNAVVARYPECRAIAAADASGRKSDSLMAGAVHRIDADTSGLVLVARTQAAFENLRAQFAAQSVKKTYLALVEGDVAAGGTLEHDLAHDPTLPFCRMIDARRNRLSPSDRARLRPLRAVSRFLPIAHLREGNEPRTLLEVTIYTGVTHQIRAQLALAGMHIVNDRLYGAFAVEGQAGHCLHALAASFRHPVSGDETEIRTPYPDWGHVP